MFGLDAIKHGIIMADISLTDLTETKDFEKEPTYMKPRMLVKGWHTGTVKRYMNAKGLSWEATEQTHVQTWRTKAQYQGINHDKMVRAILEKLLPWFNEFKWEIYEFSYGDVENYEIYMKTEHGSLYVPVKALLNGDIDAIKNRMFKYWTSYRKGSSYSLNKKAGESPEDFTARKELEYTEDIRPLASVETVKLFKHLKK